MVGYIYFETVECRRNKRKTDIFNVMSSSDHSLLGEIKWYAPWRQYCFFPSGITVWSFDCLSEVNGFIRRLMKERRMARSEKIS